MLRLDKCLLVVQCVEPFSLVRLISIYSLDFANLFSVPGACFLGGLPWNSGSSKLPVYKYLPLLNP